MGGDIAALFKVGFEKLNNDFVLELVGLGLGQLNKTMRIAGVPELTLLGKVDALRFAHGPQPCAQHGGAFRAKLVGKMGFVVDADLWESRVEVKGVPGDSEGILVATWDGGLVEANGTLQTSLADVALVVVSLWVSGGTFSVAITYPWAN